VGRDIVRSTGMIARLTATSSAGRSVVPASARKSSSWLGSFVRVSTYSLSSARMWVAAALAPDGLLAAYHSSTVQRHLLLAWAPAPVTPSSFNRSRACTGFCGRRARGLGREDGKRPRITGIRRGVTSLAEPQARAGAAPHETIRRRISTNAGSAS
jgi:hypothetical protein